MKDKRSPQILPKLLQEESPKMPPVAPLVERIKCHIKSNPVSFHMPGHKNNSSFMNSGTIAWNELLQYDLTEIPGLDNLHCAEGAIEEAQRLAANAYGVKGTYFLVNGSTAGIIASLLAATRSGDEVVIDRGCHSSVYSALTLGTLRPFYVQRPVEKSMGIPLSMHKGEVERILEANRDIRAVIITNPTYYGVCSDIKAIADIVHEKGAVLIVDEAHGAHLKFSDDLPTSSVDLGADIVIQSAHKTLPAMTQGSWLHVKGHRVNVERLERMLGIFQSTSPSYPIMASLDNARYMMEVAGQRRLKEVLELVRDTRDRINALNNGLFCPDNGYFKEKGSFDFDDTKMLINCAGAGITGYEFDKILRERYDVYGELYDGVNWMGIVTVASEKLHFKSLVRGCRDIEPAADGERILLPYFQQRPLPVLELAPFEVLDRRSTYVKLDQAEGSIAASGIVPYPPGIPLICPGERFDDEVIEQIREYMGFNVIVKGIKDGQVEIIE